VADVEDQLQVNSPCPCGLSDIYYEPAVTRRPRK
jgi:hypothetical protein